MAIFNSWADMLGKSSYQRRTPQELPDFSTVNGSDTLQNSMGVASAANAANQTVFKGAAQKLKSKPPVVRTGAQEAVARGWNPETGQFEEANAMSASSLMQSSTRPKGRLAGFGGFLSKIFGMK